MMRHGRFPRVLVALCASALLAVSLPAHASTDRLAHTFKGTGCHLIKPAPYAAPYATGSCPGVRPGGLIIIRHSATSASSCTLNFLFRGSDKRTYAGTAGHCASLKTYEKRWKGDTGLRVFSPQLNEIGRFVYGVLNDTKDFALIRLNKYIPYNPRMCHFGGPDGIYTKHELGPAILHQYGNGVYWGDTLPARTHVGLTMSDPDVVYVEGEAGPGDSGSGVTNFAGQAVGVLVAGVDSRVTGVQLPPQVPWVSGLLLITRLDVQLRRAAQVMKTKLTILNASVDTSPI